MKENSEVGKDLTIGERLALMLNDAYVLDWIGDKVFPKMNFKYLSKSKIYNQLAPLFLKYGIIIVIHEGECVQLPAIEHKASHFAVNVTMDFMNIHDRDDKITSNAWGEGTDNGGFAIGIATAYGIRSIVLNQFMISDGIELDGFSDATSGYRPMTKEEQVEVTSTVLNRAIPVTPKQTVKATVTAPKTEEKSETEQIPSEPKTEPKTEPAQAEPKLSKIMLLAFNNAKKEVEQLMQEGRFAPDQYRMLKEAMDKVVDKDTYNTFMNMKKTALDLLAKQ